MATDIHVFMRTSIIRFFLRSADGQAAVNPRNVSLQIYPSLFCVYRRPRDTHRRRCGTSVSSCLFIGSSFSAFLDDRQLLYLRQRVLVSAMGYLQNINAARKV